MSGLNLLMRIVLLVAFSIVPAMPVESDQSDCIMVFPLPPAHCQTCDGLGLAAHNLIEQVLALHPTLQVVRLADNLGRVFTDAGAFTAAIQGKSKGFESEEIAKGLGVRFTVSGTVGPDRLGTTVKLALRDEKTKKTSLVSLPLDADKGLFAFRRGLLAWFERNGLGLPETLAAKALWKEKTTTAALKAFGQAYAAHLALAYAKPGPVDMASYQAAIRAAPDSYLALQLIGWGYYRARDCEHSREAFTQALSVNPDGVAALDGLLSNAIVEEDEPVVSTWAARQARTIERNEDAAATVALACLDATRHLGESLSETDATVRLLVTTKVRRLGPACLDTAHSLRVLAGFQEAWGEYAQAGRQYKQALPILEHILGPRHETVLDVSSKFDSATTRAAILAKTGDLNGAERLALLGALADLHGWIGTLRAQGWLGQAEPIAKRAVGIATRVWGPEHPKTIAEQSALGLLYRSMGDYAQAETILRQVLAAREHTLGGEHPDTAASMDDLGQLCRDIGVVAEAEQLLRQALAIRKGLGEGHPDTAMSLSHLGGLYQSLGDLSRTLPLLGQALAIQEQLADGDKHQLAESLENMGELYEESGDLAKAGQAYRRALVIHQEVLGKAHPITAGTLNSLGRLSQKQGAYDQAASFYEQALDIAGPQWGAQHPATAAIMNNIASLFRDWGDMERARTACMELIAMAAAVGSPELAIAVYDNMRQILTAMGSPQTAVFFGKQAVNIIQTLRRNMAGMEKPLQQAVLAARKQSYTALAELLFEQNRLAEYEQILRMMKEEEYLEYIRGEAGEDDPRTTKAAFNDFEKAWNDRLAEASSALGEDIARLHKAPGEGPGTPRESGLLLESERFRVSQYTFETMLGQLMDAFATIPREQAEREAATFLPDSPQELQGLPGRPAMVAYLLREDGLCILLTTPTGRKAYLEGITAKELNKKLGHWRSLLLDPNHDPRQAGQELFRILLGKLRADLEADHVDRLVFRLDGMMRYVPMAALYDGEHYLVERYAISVYTHKSSGPGADTPHARWRVAGLGVSKGHPPLFRPLPAVPDELRGIIADEIPGHGVLPGKIRLDQEFTARTLEECLRNGYTVLHVASHFLFTPGGSDRNSFLLLGDGSHLSLAELRQGPYDFHSVELVTLSACETAVHFTTAKGCEIDGLALTMQYKGANAVLATLWNVDDASTSLFMQIFYRLHEQEGLSTSEALRKVQTVFATASTIALSGQSVIPSVATEVSASTLAPSPGPSERYGHPFYWAPFVLMTDRP